MNENAAFALQFITAIFHWTVPHCSVRATFLPATPSFTPKMKHYFKRFFEKYSQTVGNRTEIDEMMSLTFITQSAFWHHVLHPKWTWKKYLIYHILNIALILYVTFGTTEVVNTATDFQIAAEAYFTLIVIVSFPFKLFIFISNRFVYRKMYLTIKTTFYNLIRNDSEEKLAEVLRTGTRVVYIFFLMVTVPVATYELIAIWNYVRGTRVFLSRSTASLVPMTTPYYEISYIFHSVFLTEMAVVMIISDVCFVFLLYFLCMACDSLVKMLHVEPRRPDETEISYGIRLNEGLKKFYMAHLDIVEYQAKLNQMYKWMALIPLCDTALCVCIGLVVLSKEVNWHFVTLFVPMVGELFAYSWSGEQFKTKASKIKHALLKFDWTNLRLEDRRNYYIVFIYVSKEFGVRTAIGHDLSLITMTSVLKFSYQAFTVLKTVE